MIIDYQEIKKSYIVGTKFTKAFLSVLYDFAGYLIKVNLESR